MKLLQLFILFCFSTYCYAQGEANNWYFGERAGLNFNSGAVTRLVDGQLNTFEGCSTFSDKDGNLLFYSDGTTVWDRNHQIMPGGSGLRGDSSSTQSAMIIPKPGSSSEYYIFTVGARSSDNSGFHYYTIDISANGGNGAVVAGPIDLNENQAEFWSEKVAAVRSTECDAYWVVSFVQNQFVAYEVTSAGVASSPVKSDADFIAQDVRGYLKISPDGSKLAVAHTADSRLMLYDFNATTGRVTNKRDLPLNAPADKPYGVEFSSNGEMLYVHGYNDFFDNQDQAANDLAENHTSKLYQFDASLPSQSEIIASKVILDDRYLYRGALQLGPDHKIYRTLARSYFIGNNFLGVIESPNEKGTAANYVHNAVDLGTRKATQGLPPFIASIFSELEIRSSDNSERIITNQTINLCVGSSYTFIPEEVKGTPTYSWTHNDVEIFTGENLSLNNVNFNDSGRYELTIEVVDECNDVIIYEGRFLAKVFQPPSVAQNFIFEQCDIDVNPTDGVTLFNLTDKDDEIKGADKDFKVEYFDSLTDLDNNNPISNPTNHSASSSSTVYFKLTNPATGCYDTGELNLLVYPTSLDSYDAMFVCENNISTNPLYSSGSGTGSFDLERQRQNILDLFNSSDIEVGLYATIEDAQTSLNPLEGVIDMASQTVFVKITNANSSDCISVGKFDAVVNELPDLFYFEGTQILCVDNPIGNPQPHTIALDVTTNNTADSFQWFLNGSPISGATQAIWNANDEGIYTVEVSRNFPDGSTCMAHTSFEVQMSNPAVLTYDDLEIVDDSENNSITITNPNLGLGDYEFALNDINGPYQDTPYFEGILPGHHTIFIRDKFNCGISFFEVSLLGFPKFFTPNNDGYNDTWTILGLDPNFYATSKVHIFDRYGKLLVSIDPLNESWNGVYNGEILPSTDYWFSVELVDNLGTVRTRKGHFSLIRR